MGTVLSPIVVPRKVLTRVPYAVVALGLLVGVAGVATARDTTPVSAPVAAPRSTVAPPPLAEVPVAAIPVRPLANRVPAHVIVVSVAPLTDADVSAAVRATGATAELTVSAGPVSIGKGRATAIGVDPSTFRAWTPQGTAESDPLWQSIARGDASVAHVVARAFLVPLGGDVVAQATFPVRMRVGSLSTTALPGIGLVVDVARSSELGLLPRTGLLLSIPGRDSNASAALVRNVFGTRASVEAVQYETAVPAPGGWNIPCVGRVSSGFGARLHPITKLVSFHDGIDIAAPYGAPVYAMSDGVVLYAGPASGFGNEIVLSHKGGVTTVYGHISRILVTGGAVKAGQPIALVGSEGESTGPHLHAEVRVNDRPVDPIAWLRTHGVKI